MANRLERVLRILLLLKTGVAYNAAQLAQETGVHRRTIFRDIAALKGLGIPVAFDPATARYSLRSGSELDLDAVSIDELTELLLAACLAADPGTSSAEATRRVALKLATQLPPPVRDEIIRLTAPPTAAGGSGTTQELPAALRLVVGAIRERQTLSIVDRQRSGPDRVTRFLPSALAFDAGGWTATGVRSDGTSLRLQLESVEVRGEAPSRSSSNSPQRLLIFSSPSSLGVRVDRGCS